MSAFAGFVNGVFKGMDWREARDDRKRRRQWEIEDREHAMAGRGREVGGWAEEDEAKARAEQERLDAEASQRRVDESRRRAMGLDGEEVSGREMSVMDAVPDTERPAPNEGRVSSPPSSQGLTVRGALGELGQSAQGDNVGARATQDRFADRIAGQQTAQAAAPAQEQQQPVQMAEAPRTPPQGQPDPALVAEGARIAGVQPYVPGQERPAPPPAHQGFSLNGLIASPAAASTVPEGGPQRPMGQATQDAIQGRGQGYSDYTEATRGFRSDAPRRGTVEDMVAAEQAAQTAPPQASADAQARAGRINETVRGLIPQSDPVTGMLDRLNRGGMSVAGVASDAAGVAQSAVGATDAGARSFDRAQSMRDAGAKMDQQAAAPAPQGGTTSAPAGAAQATPQQQGQRGASQRTDETQVFIGDTPMSLSGRKPVNTGTVADLVGEVTGSPVSEGSMRAAGDSISKNAGMSAAQALRSDGQKKPPTKAEVRAVAKEAGVRFQRTEVDRHAKVLEAEGRFEEATAWREFAQGENTRKAMEKLSEAMFYWDMNDEGNALQSVVELYNMNGYYEDGLSALSEGTAFQYDAQGNINGLTVTFRDDATGEVFQRQVRGPRDKVMAVVIGSLSPEQTFAAAMEMVGGLKPEAQAEAPQMTQADYNAARKKALAELTAGVAGTEAPTAEAIHERAMMILQGGGTVREPPPLMQ